MIPAYVGETQLSAVLRLEYEGGHVRWIYTDPSWRYQYGPIRRSNIFDGEIYDASYTLRDWGCVAGKPAEKPVRILPAPGQKLMPQTLEPVKNQEIYSAGRMECGLRAEYCGGLSIAFAVTSFRGTEDHDFTYGISE